MKLRNKLMISALSLMILPVAQAFDFEDFGTVTMVQPRVEQINVPQEECRNEYVQVPVQQQRSAGGSIIGGIAGALLGNQIGGGTGRTAATVAGAIGGAVVGDRIDNNGNSVGGTQQQQVRQCRTVDRYESRTNGYDVTYSYKGRSYVETMAQDPGKRVRLRVSVQPIM